VRGLNFEDFAGTKESQKETGTDDCQESGESCLAPIVFRGLPLKKIDELFGRRFVHYRDATMAADPTASPLFDPSVKIRV